MCNVSGDIQLLRGCVLSRRQKRGTRGQREKFGENKYASVKEKVVGGRGGAEGHERGWSSGILWGK